MNKPELLFEDTMEIEEFAKSSRDLAKAMKMDYVSRELSLYNMLNFHPEIIARLEQKGVQAKKFSQELYFQFDTYENFGSPQEKQNSFLDAIREEGQEAWKKDAKEPDADILLISSLKKELYSLVDYREQLIDFAKNSTQSDENAEDFEDIEKTNERSVLVKKKREDVWYDCFCSAAQKTINPKKNSFLDTLTDDNKSRNAAQLARTETIKKYLFNESVSGSKFIASEKGSNTEEKPWYKKLMGSSLTQTVLIYMVVGYGMRYCDNKKEKVIDQEQKPSINIFVTPELFADTAKMHKLEKMFAPKPKPKPE